MSDVYFQNFLVIGLLVLIGGVLFVSFVLWRQMDRNHDMEQFAIAGVGHEMRIALQRFIAELGMVARGEADGPSDLLPLTHPQLDALLARPVSFDRRSMTVMRALYDELGARKLDIRSTLAQGGDTRMACEAASSGIIDALGTLYLWEMHKGAVPPEAQPTRSWHVRDWMKSHGFGADLLPGLHLRDEVVERLRAYGMRLSPKPLTHTASQYYAKQYHRKSDPHAPLWKRKQKAAMDDSALATAGVQEAS